jgi:tripartite-type tricarboxylate transporter receptor subunit TctC
VQQILAEKEMQDKLLNAGAIAHFQDPAQLAQRVQQDYTKWGKVIQTKGLAVE